MLYVPSVPDGREPRRPVEAGPTWSPPRGPTGRARAGCDPAQRDHRQPPDLRAGQARPSDRGVHYPPHPLPAPTGRGWKTLTQGGTFLFRSTPGHFYSGLISSRHRLAGNCEIVYLEFRSAVPTSQVGLTLTSVERKGRLPKMKATRLLTLALAGVVVWATPAVAQDDPPTDDDCGVNCDGCIAGNLLLEAKDAPTGDGETYSMSCGFLCRPCNVGIRELLCDLIPIFCRVGDIAPSAATIADALTLSIPTIDELRTLVETHQDRLLLDVNRHLVGIRGSGCAANSITTVIILSDEVTHRLDELGVESLDRFLSSGAKIPTT